MVDWLGLDALYVTYPDYKAGAFGRRWAGTGHAAVVIIDPVGITKYYEYGRYGTSLGKVINQAVPNVVIGSDGRATAESLAKLLKAMSNLPNANNKYGRVTVDYHDKADNIQAMLNYVGAREKENENPNRRPYGIYGYNCDSFARTTVMMGYEGWGKTGQVLDRIFDFSPDRPAGNPAKEMSYDPQTKTFAWSDKTIILR